MRVRRASSTAKDEKALDAIVGGLDMVDRKETNPKDAIGSSKLPLHLWPMIATMYGSLGLLDGALKYGRSNFRAMGVRISVYVDALYRHVSAYFEGEDFDPDSGLPHLAHALACLAILVEAHAKGNAVDDRQYPTQYRVLVQELTPHVERLRKLRAGCDVKHYTITDASPSAQALPVIRVAVGVIVDRQGRVLLQKRSLRDENFGGLWECPGGGVEQGEGVTHALHRELFEELGLTHCEIAYPPIWTGGSYGYQGREFEFSFFAVRKWSGPPSARDGQAGLRWSTPVRARTMALTPANAMAWPAIEKYARERRPK
jgi:mutator protein MutT